jgi:hypothetical protein
VTAGTLADADGVAALLAWLRGHPAVLAAYGDAAHISGVNEAPYPRLYVAPGAGGSDRNLRWLLEQEVALTSFGDVDGTPGQSALRRAHYTALAAAAALPAAAVTSAAQPVVAAVRPSSATRFAPEPGTGQPAWRSTLVLSIHPPAAVA